MRLLLSILPVQQRLATMLLQKLPEFSTAECDEPEGGPADSSTASLSSLILAQLRWCVQKVEKGTSVHNSRNTAVCPAALGLAFFFLVLVTNV